MRISSSVLWITCLVVACSLATIDAQRSKKPLTVAQVLQLIAARTPDTIVAAEVGDRGLAVPIDRGVIDSIRKAGAGRETLSRLERIRPKSAMTIRGLAGTSITLDGAYAGQIPDQGVLALNDLWPGAHDVAAALNDHLPARQAVTLRANENAEVDLSLKSVYGFLSVTTDPARATISIDGASQFRNSLAKQRMRTGSYVVRIEAPYRKPHQETIEVPSGQVVERHIALAPDTDQLSSLLLRVSQSYGNRDYRTAASDATEYIGAIGDAQPNGRARALTFLALSQLHMREYERAAATGAQALDAGEALNFEVVHHHSGFIDPHPARLTISMYAFQYEPLGSCNITRGSVDSRLVEVTFPATRLSVAGRSGTWRAVQVRLPKPNEPKETHALNFIEEDERRLNAIYGLIHSASTRRAGLSAAAAAVDPSTVFGTYTRVGKSTDYLELKSDGTFVVQQDGKTMKGTFSVAGNIVTAQSGKLTDTARIEGSRIVDRQGIVWEKPPVP